jgi:hypothetical protein
MTMNTGLYILYTANLRGNLDLLPRLYTFIRQLKALPLDEGDDVLVCAVQPVARPTLLLDLGDSCAPEVWHCAATGGRSMLMALDAMGYRAARVSLTPQDRERLRDNLMGMALVDEDAPLIDNNVLFTANEKTGTTQARPDLHIMLQPAERTRLDGNRLSLAAVQAGQIGAVHLSSRPTIDAHTIFDLPSTIAPDPTIAGTVDFILSEARRYRHKQG